MFLLTGIKFRTFIHHRPSTSDLLVKFRDNLNSQPPAIQAQILEDIVKEIKVYEDKIVLELYGSGTLNFEHKKTRHEGGSLLDGCSFRIQFGGGVCNPNLLLIIKDSYTTPEVQRQLIGF